MQLAKPAQGQPESSFSKQASSDLDLLKIYKYASIEIGLGQQAGDLGVSSQAVPFQQVYPQMTPA